MPSNCPPARPRSPRTRCACRGSPTARMPGCSSTRRRPSRSPRRGCGSPCRHPARRSPARCSTIPTAPGTGPRPTLPRCSRPGWTATWPRRNPGRRSRKPVAARRRVGCVESTHFPAPALLAAFDAQARAAPQDPPPGVWYETDGPLVRVVGEERGFISAPRDTGVRGADLDRLITRQRDYFAARGEAVEWKTYGYDEPADLPGRLRAAGFVPEDTETVVVALTTAIAAEPVLPEGVVLRQVTADTDMRRIAAMESEVWSL